MTPSNPRIPEAKRLEHLRLHLLDGMPLAEFHRYLTQTGDYTVSYAGIRNYHTSRKAPVDYYAQVSRVFGVRLEWLLFGDGEMTKSLDEARQVRESGRDWIKSLPQIAPTAWDPGDEVSQAAFLDCLQKLDRARPGTKALNPAERETLARVLDTLIAGTLWILRGDREVPKRGIRSILLALGESLPGPKAGSPYRDIVKRMKIGESSK